MGATTQKEWEDSLETLISSPKLINGLGIRGRRFIETEYSLDIMAPRMRDLLRSVAYH